MGFFFCLLDFGWVGLNGRVNGYLWNLTKAISSFLGLF